VALKPGKPLCLAAAGKKPVVVLPGFPTSALFTFHEFVAPVIRRLAGRLDDRRGRLSARMPVAVHSERGRTEYLLVNLVPGREGLAAWPLGKGSGSVSTFSKADGFLVIPAHREIIDQGSEQTVTLLSRELEPKDLVIIGSHCVGLDLIVARLRRRGFTSKILSVGSEAGLLAARAGQCDLAGIHLLDPETDTYNEPFVDATLALFRGYGRMQGLVFREGDERFLNLDLEQAVRAAAARPDTLMVNRNRGSGTRTLIDRLLGELLPDGYANQVRTHNAVAAAVQSGRADFGVAIATVAADYGLGFRPLREERYDFVAPRQRVDRAPVRAFLEVLAEPETRALLRRRGFLLDPGPREPRDE
jgi:putative molybdopterin biosynthesis protein